MPFSMPPTPPPLSIGTLRRVFDGGDGAPPEPAPDERRAGVALIMAGSGETLELCMIRRAEAEDDPWSGHMAFPGGKEDAEDPDPRAAAERETLEEVGITLRQRDFIAPLARVPAYASGVRMGIVLFPFLYYLGGKKAPFVLSNEVGEAFWIPLPYLLEPENHTTMSLKREGRMLQFPAVRYRGNHIWGLSYRILSQVAEALGRPFPPTPHQP